jgi:GTP-binding protein EngB required for normal cell division
MKPPAGGLAADPHATTGARIRPSAIRQGGAVVGRTAPAFFTTAAQLLTQLPRPGLPEVAFVGRSNAGKSTAINTLAQHRRLAFASKTPGRTQHINLFHLGAKPTHPTQLWADLPGYGYAGVSTATPSCAGSR